MIRPSDLKLPDKPNSPHSVRVRLGPRKCAYWNPDDAPRSKVPPTSQGGISGAARPKVPRIARTFKAR
jgi:hypothetical protein